MSPVGSAACVSCLILNQYSFDSFDSCSFKTKISYSFKTQVISILSQAQGPEVLKIRGKR